MQTVGRVVQGQDLSELLQILTDLGMAHSDGANRRTDYPVSESSCGAELSWEAVSGCVSMFSCYQVDRATLR